MRRRYGGDGPPAHGAAVSGWPVNTEPIYSRGDLVVEGCGQRSARWTLQQEQCASCVCRAGWTTPASEWWPLCVQARPAHDNHDQTPDLCFS